MILLSCPALRELALNDCELKFDNRGALDHANLRELVFDAVTMAADQLADFAARCVGLVNGSFALATPAPLAFLRLANKTWPRLEALELLAYVPANSVAEATLYRFLCHHAQTLLSVELPDDSMDMVAAKRVVAAWRKAMQPKHGATFSLMIGGEDVELEAEGGADNADTADAEA